MDVIIALCNRKKFSRLSRNDTF